MPKVLREKARLVQDFQVKEICLFYKGVRASSTSIFNESLALFELEVYASSKVQMKIILNFFCSRILLFHLKAMLKHHIRFLFVLNLTRMIFLNEIAFFGIELIKLSL